MNTGFVGNNQTLVLPAVYTSYINNDFVRLYGHRVGVFKLSIILTNTCRRVESYFFMTSNIPHIRTTCPNIKRYTLTHHTTVLQRHILLVHTSITTHVTFSFVTLTPLI